MAISDSAVGKLADVLKRIEDNTRPRRRMLQKFGRGYFDPGEVIAVQKHGRMYHVFLSNEWCVQISATEGEELLHYLSLDA